MSLRAGIIGFGLSGRVFHLPLLRAAGFAVTSVGVQNPKLRESIEGVSFFEVDELLTDPSVDLIVVTSPNRFHLEHGMNAIRAGKHVVIEKPLATTVQDAKTLREAAGTTDRVVTTFHSRRWDGDFMTLHRLVDSGAVGDWQIFESPLEYEQTRRSESMEGQRS